MKRWREQGAAKTWMAGSSPAMTMWGVAFSRTEGVSLPVMTGRDPVIHVSAAN
jgi:hypothetical protein